MILVRIWGRAEVLIDAAVELGHGHEQVVLSRGEGLVRVLRMLARGVVTARDQAGDAACESSFWGGF